MKAESNKSSVPVVTTNLHASKKNERRTVMSRIKNQNSTATKSNSEDDKSKIEVQTTSSQQKQINSCTDEQHSSHTIKNSKKSNATKSSPTNSNKYKAEIKLKRKTNTKEKSTKSNAISVAVNDTTKNQKISKQNDDHIIIMPETEHNDTHKVAITEEISTTELHSNAFSNEQLKVSNKNLINSENNDLDTIIHDKNSTSQRKKSVTIEDSGSKNQERKQNPKEKQERVKSKHSSLAIEEENILETKSRQVLGNSSGSKRGGESIEKKSKFSYKTTKKYSLLPQPPAVMPDSTNDRREQQDMATALAMKILRNKVHNNEYKFIKIKRLKIQIIILNSISYCYKS